MEIHLSFDRLAGIDLVDSFKIFIHPSLHGGIESIEFAVDTMRKESVLCIRVDSDSLPLSTKIFKPLFIQTIENHPAPTG